MSDAGSHLAPVAAGRRAAQPRRCEGARPYRRQRRDGSDTNSRLGIADRFLREAETGRIIQVSGSAGSEYCTLAIPFNP
jgi:hypothetical protein